MPHEILNPALYADRTVQDWHRRTFPTHHWAIDLDLMGACNMCREPLYLIESTTNPNKPTSILRALARRSGLDAFVIQHDTTRILSGNCIFPMPKRYESEAEMVEALVAIRLVHDYVHHREALERRW